MHLKIIVISIFISASLGQQQIEISGSYALESFYQGIAITSILQDSDQYIWIGSEKGIHRFDGQRLIRFKTPESFTIIGFPKLFKSKNEQLYAFSANGLLQYNKNELQFIPLTIDTIITFNNSYNSIASIADGPDNSIFLATANGLVQVYPDSIIRTNLFKSSGIDVMIHSDEYGNLWAIMRDFSLHWYNPLTKETKSYQNSSIGKVGDVNGNAIITANGLLFCSAYNGVQRLKYNNKGDITFLPIQLFTDTVNRVLSFYTEKNGQINAWAAARTHLQGEYLTVSQSDDFLLPNKKVSQFYESLADPYLFEDNNNQLWIGSLKGLIKIPSIKRFSTEYKNVRLRSPSRQNNYLQFIKDNKSIIESPEDQIINDYELFSSPNTKINIWSYYFDSDTTAILSYVRNGLKYIKRKGNTANEINIMELAETDAEKELLKSLANDFVIALKIVGDDYLISVPRNLIVWNRKTHSIIKFDKHNSKISNFVQYIETDGNISLLLSHNGVLNYYDHKLHQVISPKINSIEFPHFKNESTFSQLKFDTDGYIWLAGKELVKCDYSDSILQVKEYYSSDQLKIDGRIQFLAMNNEQLWYASTESAGCLNLSVKTLYSIPYINRYFSSLISDLTILNNGQILFVSDPDLIVMDTKKMMETEAPRIRINGIYVSNSVNSDLKFISKIDNSIEIDYFKNTISIQFSTSDYSNPEDNVFKYRLIGVNENWIDIGGRSEITFAGLMPGTYQFEVKATDSFNRPTNAVILPFFVNEPFWQSTLFVISVIFIFIFIFAYVFYLKWIKLVELANLKTQIAANLHDDLGASLAKISLFSNVLKSKTDSSYIDKITETASAAIKTLDDMVWSIDSRNDILKILINRIKYYLIEICNAKGIKYSIDENVENFEQILQASIRENVYLILKEAINNSIKHADPSKISFKVKSENKQLIFCVEDDGRKIIKPDTFRKSNGLLNMKLRSEKIGASLVVDFQQGASIMLKVPLN